MQRYFSEINNGQVLLNSDDVFHLTHVMRAKPNEEIEVVANNELFLAKVVSFTPLKIEIVSKIDENNELPSKVTLVTALLKGEKMDLVIQKATELGATKIILVETERSIVRFSNKDVENKLNRFRKIAKEAAEQSKRLSIPEIFYFDSLNKLKDLGDDVKLIAYEENKGSTAKLIENIAIGKSISILIGPEGGFAQKEVDLMNSFGFVTVGLGKRILRAETACLYALSVISSLLEK